MATPIQEVIEFINELNDQDTSEFNYYYPTIMKKLYKLHIKEMVVPKLSQDEVEIQEIVNDPGSVFVGYSQEGYNLHIWINQGKRYYIEPELNIINRIE